MYSPGRSAWTVMLAVLLVVPAAGTSGLPAGGRVSPVLGHDFRISGLAATADEQAPAVAWSPAANEYLVVWADQRGSPTRGWDIYGRRVGPDGARLGDDFRISGRGAVSDEGAPAVSWDEVAAQYLVVWADQRGSPTRGWDIYGRRVGADGSRLGRDLRISGPGATSDERTPAVSCSQATGGCFVVWSDGRNLGSRGTDVYGRVVGAGGVLAEAEHRISGRNAIADEWAPAVAWSQSAGEYLVAWSGNGGSEIRGRLVGADGVPSNVGFRINESEAGGGVWAPAVAWAGATEELLVAWEAQDIYGRRVSRDGGPVGHDIRISGRAAAGSAWLPAVTWNQASNEYLVVWMDGRSGWDIYGQRMAAGGTKVSFNFRISGRGTTGGAAAPALAWNSTLNQYLIVWQDERSQATRGADIYGRRVAG